MFIFQSKYYLNENIFNNKSPCCDYGTLIFLKHSKIVSFA